MSVNLESDSNLLLNNESPLRPLALGKVAMGTCYSIAQFATATIPVLACVFVLPIALAATMYITTETLDPIICKSHGIPKYLATGAKEGLVWAEILVYIGIFNIVIRNEDRIKALSAYFEEIALDYCANSFLFPHTKKKCS